MTRDVKEEIAHHRIIINFGDLLLTQATLTTQQFYAFYAMNYGHPDDRQEDLIIESEPEIIEIYVEGNEGGKHEVLEKLLIAEYEKGNETLDLSKFIALNN